VDAEKQAGAKTAKHVTNTCISQKKLIKGSPNPIIAMSQRLESYYNKVNIWNPIIAKRDVWSPIIANFSSLPSWSPRLAQTERTHVRKLLGGKFQPYEDSDPPPASYD
jgi:hypothetical protein